LAKRKEIPGLNIALLDILTGALGAVIILFVSVPKKGVEEKQISSAEVEIIEKENTKLHSKIRSKNQEIEDLRKIVIELEGENELLTKRGEKERLENEGKRSLSSQESPQENSKADSFRGKGLPVDVGFKFKGKQLVFIIDVSGSMLRENRLGQVKAGIKMLITSLPKDYEVDIIFFPDQSNPYKPLWGATQKMDVDKKDEVYNFLYNLRARGFTPTKDALVYGLKNYPYASDIILLSDGAPTDGNQNRNADISEILLQINNLNKNKMRINTIGVGRSFIGDRSSKAYVFLNELAKDHGGFFYGF